MRRDRTVNCSLWALLIVIEMREAGSLGMNPAYSFPMSAIFKLSAGNSPRRHASASASGKILPLRHVQQFDRIIQGAKRGLVRFLNPTSDEPAVMDYSAALASAVAWLGNRYLLARPVKRLTHPERPDTDLTPAPSGPAAPAAARPLWFRELINHGDDACQDRPTHP
jgi:hypothetical protein